MSDRLHVATTKGLFTVTRGDDGRWSVEKGEFLGDSVTMLLHDGRDDTLYAAKGHGHFGAKMHRSSDGGDTWEEIATPTYPERPADAEDKDRYGKPLSWSLQRIWDLEPGTPEQPGVVWAGTVPGALFRSPDRGDSWEIVRSSLGRADSRRVVRWRPRPSRECTRSASIPPTVIRSSVGVSCGGVWFTADGGATWECRADGMFAAYLPPETQTRPHICRIPTGSSAVRSNPEHLWAQHHNGVFRSTNSAKSWQEISGHRAVGLRLSRSRSIRTTPTPPGSSPATKDEKRIPVDGRVVVARTRDGGKTFDVLRNGLPQEHAYDLTYRHSLDVDESGDRLAFGSTTGTLWVTEDQGESWRTVSKHLPPIWAVRFKK